MVRRLLPALAVGAIALTAHAAWNRRVLRRPTPVDADITESIAVHIPARNEADALGDALSSVQRQRGIPQATIHVLDDGSSDGTAEMLSAQPPTIRECASRAHPMRRHHQDGSERTSRARD